MLEVFSLPPFLDELEHSLLEHTLRSYPSGLPADEGGNAVLDTRLPPPGASPDRPPLSSGLSCTAARLELTQPQALACPRLSPA